MSLAHNCEPETSRLNEVKCVKDFQTRRSIYFLSFYSFFLLFFLPFLPSSSFFFCFFSGYWVSLAFFLSLLIFGELYNFEPRFISFLPYHIFSSSSFFPFDGGIILIISSYLLRLSTPSFVIKLLVSKFVVRGMFFCKMIFHSLANFKQ